jgi:hypothetical protein
VEEVGWPGVGMNTANFHSTISCTLCFVNRRGVERRVTNLYLMWFGDEFLQNSLWLVHKNAVKVPQEGVFQPVFSAISVHFVIETDN